MAEDDEKPAANEPVRPSEPSPNASRNSIEPTAQVPQASSEPHFAPASVDHPPRSPQTITPDPIVRERKPLNPAYAILAGAVLTAASGITATFLTIRSSERLTRERDRTDLARQERDDLAKELEKVKTDLANQSEQLQQFSSTTLPPVTQPTIPPSIVVVLPPQATVVPTVTVSVAATKAPLVPEERPTTVPEPTPATTVPVSVPVPTTTSSTTTIPVPTTTFQAAVPTSAVPAPAGAGAVAPTTFKP